MERIQKDLCSIFSEHSLKITTKNIVNFLKVTLDLTNGKYVPYTKANIPLYLHKRSNHPPRSIDNISQSFNNRLSEISYDEDLFTKATSVYQKALDDTGYKHRLNLSDQPTTVTAHATCKPYRREEKFSGPTPLPPTHSKNVATYVGRNVLKIFDEEFPMNISRHQIFNRNS